MVHIKKVIFAYIKLSVRILTSMHLTTKKSLKYENMSSLKLHNSTYQY